MELTTIAEFKAGEPIRGFFLCREKWIRRTRIGDPYLNLLLQDRSGFIEAKLWDRLPEFRDRFEAGDPLAIKGTPAEYNGELQLTVTQLNKATAARYGRYGFDPEALIPEAEIPPEELFRELLKLTDHIQDSNLAHLLQSIFTHYQKTIEFLPGSLDKHHPVRGGWLQHVVDSGKLALAVAKIYSALDPDLLLAGILLHDIGKVKSVATGLQNSHSDSGLLVGHPILGRDILREFAAQADNLSEVTLSKLEHIILAHQHTPQRGSAVTPKFPEALAVAYLDELDGRLDLMRRIIAADQQNQEWTDDRHYFHRQLWKK